MRPVGFEIRARRPVVILGDHQHGRNDTTLRAVAAVLVKYDHEHRRPTVGVPKHPHALGWAIALDDRDIRVFNLLAASPCLADREVMIGGSSLPETMDRVVGELDGVALAVGQRAGVIAGGVFGAHSPTTTATVTTTPMVSPYIAPQIAA